MKSINALNRTELAALVVECLRSEGIDVVLVGGSCVCIYSDERFASFDLDFIDLSYARKRDIAEALEKIGFRSSGGSRYFLRDGCQWSLEFPTGPLAIGREQIPGKNIAEIETDLGTIRLLSPTDCVKDRLLWWYLEKDGQCLEQAMEIARRKPIDWKALKAWHDNEGYGKRFDAFQASTNAD